ncbi:MAG: hypothetical protein J0M08_01005, partial [Bacteroidetes bacterium]|nr:hypothetical protein [Bacteroidota bacterium]
MKKNNLLFFILLVTGLGKVFGQLTPDILYYKFDGSGTAVPNLATAATSVTDTATLMGALTQGGNGLCKGALIGTGGSSSNDYLNTNWTPNITGSSWTISFRTSNVQQSTSTSYIFGDVNSGSFRCFTGGVA